MPELILKTQAGPCDSAEEIRAWIDELLELRQALADESAAVREIDHQLRRAVVWLEDREAGKRCA